MQIIDERGGGGWGGGGSIHKAGDEPGWGGVVRGGVKDLKGGYGRGFVRVVVFRVAVA